MIDDTNALPSLRDAPPPPLAEVRLRVVRRRNRRRGLRIAAVAAMAALLLVVRPGVRDRGVGELPLVALDAVAEGPAGVRPLGDGALVGPDERVVFFVRSSLDGTATLRELDGSAPVSVLPPWAIDSGESAIGGGTPMSWRPDRTVDRVRYELSVCAAPDRCSTDALDLRWAP